MKSMHRTIGIYLMDVTLPPYPTPPQPDDKDCDVPAMFDYQRMQLNFSFQLARLWGKVVKLCQVMSNCSSRFPSFL